MAETETSSFDANLAAVVLLALAELADQHPSLVIQPVHPLFRAAAEALGDAKRWIERYTTPFDDFTGDYLLKARKRGRAVGRDKFISVTTIASLELAVIARLIELRDIRIVQRTMLVNESVQRCRIRRSHHPVARVRPLDSNRVPDEGR
jgi:hypothetical protein